MCVQNLDVDKYLNKSAVTSLYVCVLLHSCCAWDMEICSEVCLSVAGFTISDSECVCVRARMHYLVLQCVQSHLMFLLFAL